MERKSLSILVALHGGGLSGIDTYAEQVAAAAAASGHRVTLIGAGEQAALALRNRAPAQVDVRHTAAPGGSRIRRFSRKVPTLELAEMRALLSAELAAMGDTFDVVHLNHPGLAVAARPYAKRVVAGAWFYPHRPVARMVETWLHTGAQFPRSAAFALKGLTHYLNDRGGYRRCDAVAAPTEALAAQLRSQGVAAISCPPPVRQVAAVDRAHHAKAAETTRILVCCGDLGHPRKNVAAGVKAVASLAERGRRIELVLIGRNVSRLASELAVLPPSITVRTPGPLPREEIYTWMESSDLLLLPSLYEEWGYVATEALMAGTPVAAFPVYPFTEILSTTLGACAGDMTPTAMATTIEQVLDSGHSRSDVRAAAIRCYGSDAATRRLQALWVGSPARRAPVAVGAERVVPQ